MNANAYRYVTAVHLSVIGPPAVVQPGRTMTFRAEVTGGDQQNLNYNWSVDKGSIVSGQGTPSIVVGGTDSLAGANSDRDG